MNDGFHTAHDEFHPSNDGRLDPIGRSLRSTFEPPDGEELQPRIASLMIELSHQDYEPEDCSPLTNEAAPAKASLMHRLTRFLQRD
ncbi:hypothetical protein SAMN05192583_2316 [Sphingomonas gellani]|uniref:Uncharacterized protein n=1 Tax=Sphingomonas gellani TaxID=1166340 RepID=A0A1H8EWY6_9SPHN|nr:hypothetical protein [Sphingomonas gellani]SEN23268.1 hypothetical protein SAMN05192583_2316 [Sphingomonas gellani]